MSDRGRRAVLAAELAAFVPPAPLREVTVRSADGTRLHAQVFGKDRAPTIVLAHGITCAVRVWTYQINALAERYRVVAYDQRGHGRSERPRRAERLTVRALGEDLQAVLEQCIPDGRPAIVAGHSLGGITIMSWAQQFPDEVPRRAAAAVLINTAPSAILDFVGGVRALESLSAVTRGVARMRVYTPILLGSRSAMRWLTFGETVRRVDLAVLGALINGCPPRTRAGFARDLAVTDLLPGLGSLTVPTLVIAGQQDRLLPPSHSRRIAEALPNPLALEVLRGVGHMALFEDADVVNARLSTLADTYAPSAQNRTSTNGMRR